MKNFLLIFLIISCNTKYSNLDFRELYNITDHYLNIENKEVKNQKYLNYNLIISTKITEENEKTQAIKNFSETRKLYDIYKFESIIYRYKKKSEIEMFRNYDYVEVSFKKLRTSNDFIQEISSKFLIYKRFSFIYIINGNDIELVDIRYEVL